VDSIVDIVAVAAAIDHLGARVVSSPLPMAHGHIHAEHGVLPLPAPATVLCLRGVPTYDGGADRELVTPTGACLVATLAEEHSFWPSMRPARVGWGAGTRELEDRPNLLRVVLGDPEPSSATATGHATHVLLETNVDDASPEIIAHALAKIMSLGALDAWASPIVMKKGRPAHLVSVLARASSADELGRALLRETGSLGLRRVGVDRMERPRRMAHVETPYGPISVKVAEGDGLPPHAAPEYEDCRRAAEAHDVPISMVYHAALAALREP